MNTIMPSFSSEPSHRSRVWYQAYMTALFEADQDQLPEKIRDAEALMIAREREVIAVQGTALERGALDKAFHALDALRMCLKFGTAK